MGCQQEHKNKYADLRTACSTKLNIRFIARGQTKNPLLSYFLYIFSDLPRSSAIRVNSCSLKLIKDDFDAWSEDTCTAVLAVIDYG